MILAVSQGPVGFSKLVVLKRLRDHLAEDPEFVSMLIDEARLAARLNHPNIVHTNEVGEIDGRFFIAMEYLEGQPLTRIRRRAGRKKFEAFTRNMHIEILANVLSGLHYAHELADFDGKALGVVHRDVTPSNVFVTYEGQVKIVDFGIAKATGRTTETRTGVVKGKMTYMPPEQALGNEVDRRADLFSVGVMLWEACVGQRMWKGLEDIVILGKLINGEVPKSPMEVLPELDPRLDDICMKALAPEPEDRFETALEFQTALEEYLEGRTVGAREMARTVTTLFESERNQLKGIIEDQLSRIDKDRLIVPVTVPHSMPSSGTPSATDTEWAVEPMPRSVADGVNVMTKSSAAPAARKPSVGWLVAALAGVVAILLWVVLRAPAPDPPATASTAAASATAAAPEQSPATIRVTLRASPPSARFAIDGGAWLDNPYVGELPRDGREHAIEVKADGYEVKRVSVKFDKDVMLDTTLGEKTSEKKKPRPTSGRRVVRPDPGDPPNQPKGKPLKGRTPGKLLDEDPWD